MNPNIHMQAMSWVEYARRVRQEDAIVILPVGSLEQHGPHLPMGTDALVPSALAERVAARIGAIVAAPFNYGYKSLPRSGGGQRFPGTTSLDGHSLCAMLRDVIRELARHGVRKLAVMDGHYENQMFLIEGIDLALRELDQAGRGGLRICRIDWWAFTSDATIAKIFPEGFPGWPLEHGAVVETSLMMALHPELVRPDLVPHHPPASFPLYDIYPEPAGCVPSSGALSSARAASREKGEALIAEYVPAIATALLAAFADMPSARASGGA
jgi:creatinine amidohydrolase